MADAETKRGRPRFSEPHENATKFSCTLPPETYKRLEKFCKDEERSKAWCINKAIIIWLEERGY